MDPEILEALGLTEDDWEGMAPNEQASILQQVGLGQANALPASFLGTGMAPSLSPSNFDLSGMMGGATFQNYDSKGNPEPIEQAQAGQINNLMQDQASLYVDNVLAMLSGPGAYETGAFTPQRKFGKLLPGRAQINALADNPTGGFRSLIADRIRQGASPEEAENAVWDAISRVDVNDESLTDADRARVQSLLATLPSAKSTGGGGTEISDYLNQGRGGAPSGIEGRENRAAYDQATISKAAQDMFSSWTTEQSGWQDPESGRWYEAPPEEIKTPMMEWYDKYQLPYPTASYGDEQHVNAALQAETGRTPEMQGFAVEDYRDEMSGMEAQRKKAADVAKQAREQATSFASQMDEYTKAYDTWKGTQPANRPPVTGGQSIRLPGGARMPTGTIPQQGQPAPQAPFVFAPEGSADYQTGTYEEMMGLRRTPMPGNADVIPNSGGAYTFGGDTYSPGGQEQPEGSAGWLEPSGRKTGDVRAGRVTDQVVFNKAAREAERKRSRVSHAAFEATKRDPRLDIFAAAVMGNRMAKDDRTPLRDALAQRALAASVMRGY